MHKGIGNTTGVYTVYVDVDGMIEALQVYCDMDTDGGGYTVTNIVMFAHNVRIDYILFLKFVISASMVQTP